MDILEDIKRSFREGDALTKLILANLTVFVLVLLLKIFSFLLQTNILYWFIEFTALPSYLPKLATRPWTFFTYMFLHEGFLHILFNMLWLFFAGRLFMEYLGGKRLMNVYLLGGLIGGLLYVIFYNVFPSFRDVLIDSNNRGASAGVMAIVVAIATYRPQYPVKLFFVINVPLWGVAALALLLDLTNLGEGVNAGGHIAHLGGAAFGFLFARQILAGKDITTWFGKIMDSIVNLFKRKPKVRKVYSNKRRMSDATFNQQKAADKDRMDQILDKISRSGYDSLSKDEKDFLFKIGKE